MNDPRLERVIGRLDALVNWEHRDRSAGMRRGLEPALDLLERLGNPQQRWRAVHVAGTKGKGTTSALIAKGLQRSGARVGLYTSPHVSDVCERVLIDGRKVDEQLFAQALEDALAAREQALLEREHSLDAGANARDATWFDLLTAGAFLCFARAGVEWAVVECGLGGRLDSTNVVRGEVCVVTNIDLEHTAVLGTTRAAIAREKGGILKPGATLVTSLAPAARLAAEDDAGAVLADMAATLGCAVLRPARVADTIIGRNVELARLVLDELGRRGVRVRHGALPQGRGGKPPSGRGGKPLDGTALDPLAILSARLPARCERMWHGSTRVILDAAHVASSVTMVLDELASDPELRALPIAILALGRDKDAHAILKALAGRVDRLLCSTTASGPLVAAETLAKQAQELGIEAETAADPDLALARALALVSHEPVSERWVLVIGSFYLAGALRSRLSPEPTSQP